MNFRERCVAGILAGFTRLATGALARWFTPPPAPDAPARVYFANHASHLDFVTLWASLPVQLRAKTRPVAAADYWCRGLRAYLAQKVFRAVLVDRGVGRKPAAAGPENQGHGDTIPRLSEVLASGESLIFFPEGTRGTGEHVAPFKSGLYHLCNTNPGLEVVPVYLENMNRVLPKGEVLLIPIVCKLSFGEPLHLHEGEAKQAFLDRAHEALCALRDR